MGLDINYIAGQTPIDEDEKEGLKVKTISNRSELNQFEQLNIEQAILWSLESKFEINYILSETFVKELHKKMFGDVWKWAGQFRTSNKNIGADKFLISTELRILFEDCKYWIENHTYSEDETAVRFSHRIVSIHPFPNGNGRHSRLIADILIENGLGREHFSWGVKELSGIGNERTTYLYALREADKGNIQPLLNFARK